MGFLVGLGGHFRKADTPAVELVVSSFPGCEHRCGRARELDGQIAMGQEIQRLSALAVTRASKPGLYADGAGLYLRVGRNGSKSWAFRFTLRGKPREMGLGGLTKVTLADARKKAADARLLLSDGRDPLGLRQEKEARRVTEEKIAAARGMTFEKCAEAYIAAHEPSWRNEKHKQQWRNTIKSYVTPVFGNTPVQDIDLDLVMKVIEPIWTKKTETARRIRGRIEVILDWARVRGYRSGENPARWRGQMDQLLPARSKLNSVKHHPALPYSEIPEFMQSGPKSISKRSFGSCPPLE
jgi:hypothetical protein